MLFGPSVLQECNVPDVIRRYVMATLQSTGFHMREDEEVAYMSRCGTCPGAPPADVLFQAVLMRSLSELHSLMVASGSVVNVLDAVTEQTHAACSPTWVDDVAILLMVDKSDQLIDQIRLVIQHAQSALELVGIQTFFSPGNLRPLLSSMGQGVRHRKKFGSVRTSLTCLSN